MGSRSALTLAGAIGGKGSADMLEFSDRSSSDEDSRRRAFDEELGAARYSSSTVHTVDLRAEDLGGCIFRMVG